MSDVGRNHTFDPVHITGSLANNFRDGLARRQDQVFARAADRMASQMRDDAKRANDDALRAMAEARRWTETEASNRRHREAVEAHNRATQLERNAASLRNAAEAARARHRSDEDGSPDGGKRTTKDSRPARESRYGTWSDWIDWSIYGGWPPLLRRWQDGGRAPSPRPGGHIPKRSDNSPDPKKPPTRVEDPPVKEPNWQFEAFKMRVKEDYCERTGEEMSDAEFEKWLDRNGVAEDGFDIVGVVATGAIRGGKAVAKKVAAMAAAYLSGEALEKFKGELGKILEKYENSVRDRMGKGYLGQ